MTWLRLATVEAAGIEPRSHCDTTDDLTTTYYVCSVCSAVNALQTGDTMGLLEASIDADLLRLITVWSDLSLQTKSAIADLF